MSSAAVMIGALRVKLILDNGPAFNAPHGHVCLKIYTVQATPSSPKARSQTCNFAFEMGKYQLRQSTVKHLISAVSDFGGFLKITYWRILILAFIL